MIFLDEDDVASLGNQPGLMTALADAFSGGDTLPARLDYDLPGSDGAKLLVTPSWRDRDVLGVKVLTVMPRNTACGVPSINGLYLLLDGPTGRPRAVLSAAGLTGQRTAGVSALAARYLARQDAKTLLIVGTGALAPYMARAHCKVRNFDRILVWGRNLSKAQATADGLADLCRPIEVVTDLGAAVARSDVISCATSSQEALVAGDLLKPGTHVDLVGSFTPAMREADLAVFARGRLVVDTSHALVESGDLVPVFGLSSSDTVATRHGRHLGAAHRRPKACPPECARDHGLQIRRDRPRRRRRRTVAGEPRRMRGRRRRRHFSTQVAQNAHKAGP